MNSFCKDMAIIGISPRNSYYSDKQNIEFVLDRVMREFGTAYVFIPGILDRHNYLAYGYKKERADNKACEVSEALKKSVHEVCHNNHISIGDSVDCPTQVRLVNWASEVDESPFYQESLAQILGLYNSNQEFHNDVRAVSQSSIESRMNSNSETRKYIQKTGLDGAIDHAVKYILGEIAFIQATPDIYGVESVSYFYHRSWTIFEKYISGAYGVKRPYMKFCIANREYR